MFREAKKVADEHLLINLLMNWELNDEYEEIQTEIQVRKLGKRKMPLDSALKTAKTPLGT